MKKILPLILCIVLLAGVLSVPAAAGTDMSRYAIANGTVQAADYDDITAPCSGTLLPFDLDPGDDVKAGAALFELLTTEIYAPEDGTVGYLFAAEGESADAAMATYGAVLTLQPAVKQRIHGKRRGDGRRGVGGELKVSGLPCGRIAPASAFICFVT